VLIFFFRLPPRAVLVPRHWFVLVLSTAFDGKKGTPRRPANRSPTHHFN